MVNSSLGNTGSPELTWALTMPAMRLSRSRLTAGRTLGDGWSNFSTGRGSKAASRGTPAPTFAKATKVVAVPAGAGSVATAPDGLSRLKPKKRERMG